jgi:hypothetical protein
LLLTSSALHLARENRHNQNRWEKYIVIDRQIRDRDARLDGYQRSWGRQMERAEEPSVVPAMAQVQPHARAGPDKEAR